MKIVGSNIIGKEQYDKIMLVHSEAKLKVAYKIAELYLFLRLLLEEAGDLIL